MSGLKYLIDHPQEVKKPEKRMGGIALLAQEGKEKNQGGIPGAIGYIAGRAGTDFLRVGEGVVDAALVPVDLLTGNVDRAKSRFMDSPVDAMRERLDEEYNPGKVAGFIGDIAGGIGQSVGYGLISAIPYAGTPMMYSSIVEQSISSAAEKTGKVGLKEIGYGATAGAVEGILESKLGAGVNAAKGIGSAILKKTGINVAESAAKAGGKSLLKTLAIDTAKGFAGEFGEEFISEAVDPKLQNIWGIDKDARFSFKDSFRAGIVGGISGGAISIGPSAINYKSAVSVGRALQESRLDGDLINRAKYTLSALEAAQTRSTGQIKGKPEGDTKETAKEWLTRTSENRKVKRLSKETAQLADKIRRNIQAYETSMADPAMAQSEPVAALLGELRGNLFLVGYAYEADVIEQVMMEADDKQRQAFVDAINEELAAQGKKHDYTLADFDANKDDIRRGLAGLLMADEMQGYTAEYGAEATDSPAEPAQAPKDTTAEEVTAQEKTAATEDLSGIEEEVWRAMTDETVKGYGTQNEQEVALLRAAVSQNVPEKSIPLMLERFREGTDMTPAEFADAWADGVLLFGRLGLNEATISQESALSRMSEKARRESIEYGKWLSEEQRSKEQEAAKKKKRPVKEGESRKPKGEVVRHPGINLKADLDDAQFTAYKAAEIMAPALKADIEIHKGLERNGKQVNGYYDTKTNTIHINIDAVRDGKHIALYTLGHEVAHYIKAWSPKKFYELGDYVMDQLGEKAEKAVRDKLDFMKRNGLVDGLDETEAYDRAYEEVVADGMELVLTDGTVLDALARENKTLWQKIKDRIFEIIDKIKKAYGDLSKTSRTAQILSETMDSLDDIEQLFYEGVTEAGERTRTAGVENTLEDNGSPTRKYLISEEISSTLSAEDQNLLFDTDFYERYENESREPITETVEELEAVKASEAFATMSDDEAFDLNAKLKAKRAGYNTVYDYYVETEKERMAEEYRRYLQTGRSNRTSRTLEEKRKKAQKERTLRSDEASATPLQNAQYKIIQETNPMWDEYHTGIRSSKEIKTFAEVAEDPDSFTWGDFTREDARKALRDGTVRVYSSYAIKNGVFVSTSYQQALEYAGNDPARVHSRVVALDSVAWINGDEGQYAKVYKDDGIRYSIDEDTDTAYLAAVERGDMETARRMVDEAAKRAGYRFKAKHYTDAKFTVFDPEKIGSSQDDGYFGRGFYFTSLENFGRGFGSNRMDVYLRAQNPLIISELNRGERQELYDYVTTRPSEDMLDEGYEIRETDGETVVYNPSYDEEFGFDRFTDDGLHHGYFGTVFSQAITDWAQSNGFDAIFSEKPSESGGVREIVLFSNRRVKSADPVTYDDNGNVIPLSERFREDDSDIRYSIDETPETPDVSENRDLTDREILGMALEGAVQSQEEYNIVKSYREQAAMLETVREKKDGYAKEANALERQIKALRARMEDEGDPDGWIRKAMDEAIAKKREAERMRDEQVKILDNADRELLRMKAAKPFREIVDREQKRRRAEERRAERAEEVADRKVERARESAEKKIAKEKERMEEQSKQSKERKEITIRMREARRVLGYLNTMLYHPTKQKHVPESLQALVEKALRSADPKQFGINRDHIREMSELAGKTRNLESKAGRTTAEQETLDKMKTKYEKLEADTISVKRQAEALMTAFEQYVTSTTDGEQIDKNMLEGLRQTVTEIEEAPLNEMTLKSLKAVEKIYTVIYHQVNTANQAFATKKAANIDEMSTEANTQVKEAKELKVLSPRSREWAALAGVRSFLWKNMKPLTVFEAIGSNKLMEIFRRVLDAEDVWITDILEAKKALDEAKKEFGYNKWNLKERREVTTADGSKVSLTLGEMMSLYAYMFREQAEEHLSAGGFVFAPNAEAIESFKGDKVKYRSHLNDQTTHRMRKQDIDKMSELLTEEQRAYAKAVQEYLTSLGAKGNEVSSKLYGIDLFKETAYFPIKSSHDYIETSTGKSGDPNIKSRGTFKETVPKAGNPIVLEDFMEVVGNHVNTMATYHAFVLPVEDLTRVWNYTPVNIKRDADGKAILDENGMPVADTEGEAGYNSLKAEITKKYGKEANDYILQLLRDLNGGARRESAASILDKGLTAFKRSATMLSLSTIVQQPTSIIRAMAYVDAKHFTGASFVPWDTVKKYAPVAAIKEMGGFDTGTGARTDEYINAKQYDSIKDAAKAAVTPEIYGGDPNVRAEAFGWMTGKADEVSWRYMFGAIVNEQAEKLGKAKDSEAVLKAAGERFAEVVRRTQVYDSTLTRSEYMRSKDGLMKMATAFGAEPTTVVSMVADAIIKAERGDKTFLRKSAAGIAFSIIANAAVASLIYAMRDDDEDETIPEKYVQSLTSELIEGFNPLEYLPIARDIMSMFKGYEIERSDMALVGNLMEQVELITSSKRSVPDKIFGVTGAVSAFFGLPVTNVYRDFKGLVKTGQSFTDAEEQTGAGLGHAMGDAVRGQFNLFSKLFGAESGNAYELYTAYVRGDTAHYNRVKARYKTPQAAELALRTELRDNDKRISEAAEARLSGDLAVYESIVDQIESEGIFDRNIVIRAINNEVSELKRAAEKGELVPKDETVTDEETAESLYTASDLNAALERGDTEDFAAIMAALVQDKVSTGKTEAQAKASVKSSITAYWKKQYLSGYQDTETRKRIIAILTETGLYGSRNDVATMCEGWVKNSK